ncbi:MAG: TIR domain-containing protein [Ignavibacteriaceae bacterium]|jgi:hypothetical protein
MGKKIFVTYKYSDSDVLSLNYNSKTTVRNYVDELQKLIEKGDHINKGEKDNESLDSFKDSTIASKLRDKIYDSSVTIVMISQGMKESNKLESEQWIPWEISYSLKELTREEKTSKSNAVLAVVLPDILGRYDYFISEDACPYCHYTLYKTNILFKILSKNMFNQKKPNLSVCTQHTNGSYIYKGYFSYIYSVKWSEFKLDINKYIDIAVQIKSAIDEYNITKEVS